uniref:Uncharacterized protein n=1 Tax=Desertifilum tharense IPPAS B-1220 TaxID=1781255 RepID=A0ACD5GX03_9CYAN
MTRFRRWAEMARDSSDRQKQSLIFRTETGNCAYLERICDRDIA